MLHVGNKLMEMNKKPLKYSKEEAIKLYKTIDKGYAKRIEVFDLLLNSYFEVVEDYAELFSRISYIIGFISPKDNYESTQRDIAADSFDFLNETKYLIKRGRYDLAFVLARRSFESLTRSEELVQGKSVDLGGRRIIKKKNK